MQGKHEVGSDRDRLGALGARILHRVQKQGIGVDLVHLDRRGADVGGVRVAHSARVLLLVALLSRLSRFLSLRLPRQARAL